MFIFMSDFSRCFSSIQSILHLQAVSRGQLPLQDSTHAADRALHALCRWPMLVLLLVLPLPLPMCDTECAIFFFFSLVYIPQMFSFFSPWDEMDERHCVEALCPRMFFCQAFPRKILNRSFPFHMT